MANTYLTRTPSSASNRKTWTWSAWVKRSNLDTGDIHVLFQALDGSYPEKLQFKTNYVLEYDHDIAGSDYTLRAAMLFRDTSAWYHIVVAKDTTQATETNRLKIYVNGEQQTLTEVQLGYPPQNYDGAINNNVAHHIGSNNGSEFFDGSMSHIHFIDGTAYDATAFGETDATTGEWKAKTSPSVTYGTNGFLILKDGNTITDQSSNSNAFTLSGGTLTDLKDNPDNVFATLNPLDNIAASTFSNGNNTVATVNGNAACNTSTIGALTGKWYWEVKMTAGESNSEAYIIGLVNKSPVVTGYNGSILANGFGLRGDGNINNISGGTTGGWNTFAVNNIINVAIDFDNGKAYFGTNGVYGNSSNPSTASNGYSFTVGDEFWRMAVNCRETSKDGIFQCNFGNGYFGTTAITTNSGNGYSGAEGSSKFNYTVPTGYSALSTKGLNE